MREFAEDPSISDDPALATRRPGWFERRQIAREIDAGNYDEAIRRTEEAYGIDQRNVGGGRARYDPELKGYGSTNPASRDVRIGPLAMRNESGKPDPGLLASTLLHETQHANDMAAGFQKPTAAFYEASESIDETRAWGAESKASATTRMNTDERRLVEDSREARTAEFHSDRRNALRGRIDHSGKEQDQWKESRKGTDPDEAGYERVQGQPAASAGEGAREASERRQTWREKLSPAAENDCQSSQSDRLSWRASISEAAANQPSGSCEAAPRMSRRE